MFETPLDLVWLIAGALAAVFGIEALRWRHVDFEAGHISIEQSAEQTRAGVR